MHPKPERYSFRFAAGQTVLRPSAPRNFLYSITHALIRYQQNVDGIAQGINETVIPASSFVISDVGKFSYNSNVLTDKAAIMT